MAKVPTTFSFASEGIDPAYQSSVAERPKSVSKMLAGLICFFAVLMSASMVHAACKSGALGTHRTLPVDASKFRTFNGTEKALGLRDKEVILTFDDGPIGRNTANILKALEKECVKATFFFVGKMARAYPHQVRQVVRQGHTLAHHTHGHEVLPKYSTKKASRIVDRGVKGLQKIAYGDSSHKPRTPFFRYPYLASSKRTDRLLAHKGLVAFGANIDSLDWKIKNSKRIHDNIMRQLKRKRRGIILMHDIHARTAKMLPGLLRSLKVGGYKVVHIVPKQGGTQIAMGAVDEPKKGKGKSVKRRTKFKRLSNRQIAKLSAREQKLYWTRYWYVKRGRKIPRHLR